MATTKLTKTAMGRLLKEAQAAAGAAYKGASPTAMVVQDVEDPFGEMLGTSDGGAVLKEWVVEGGVCGFAWVNVKPGNSRMANYLRSKGVGQTDGYYGGLTVYEGGLGIPLSQSYERKMAAGQAFAEVLRSGAGVEAYAMGRVD